MWVLTCKNKSICFDLLALYFVLNLLRGKQTALKFEEVT